MKERQLTPGLHKTLCNVCELIDDGYNTVKLLVEKMHAPQHTVETWLIRLTKQIEVVTGEKAGQKNKAGRRELVYVCAENWRAVLANHLSKAEVDKYVPKYSVTTELHPLDVAFGRVPVEQVRNKHARIIVGQRNTAPKDKPRARHYPSGSFLSTAI